MGRVGDVFRAGMEMGLAGVFEDLGWRRGVGGGGLFFEAIYGTRWG